MHHCCPSYTLQAIVVFTSVCVLSYQFGNYIGPELSDAESDSDDSESEESMSEEDDDDTKALEDEPAAAA